MPTPAQLRISRGSGAELPGSARSNITVQVPTVVERQSDISFLKRIWISGSLTAAVVYVIIIFIGIAVALLLLLSSFMMEGKNFIFSEYQRVCNKLKKRRILKKPNVTEASQQFENLGMLCENDDLPQYAGMCYQAAGNCHSSLGSSPEQGYLFLKACRQYMLNYSRSVSHEMVSTDENFHDGLVCYKQCWDSFISNKDPNVPDVNLILAGICLEMANAMEDKFGRVEESIDEYKKTLKLLDNFPMQKVICLRKIISIKIGLEEYDDALNYTNDLVKEIEKVPDGGYKEDVVCSSEISRVLLVLILQPTPHQISSSSSSLLEKYAWLETAENREMADLQTTLAKNNLCVKNERLFLCLQSLVMACQYGETDYLATLENELLPFLNFEQRDLLRILVKKKLRK